MKGELLKGKVAVVTGAGRGIGRGEALSLAAYGASVVVNDLGGGVDGSGGASAPADDVVAEIKKAGGAGVANYDSVTTWQGAENIIKAAMDNFGRIDILVNNAGVLRDRMVFNMGEDEWDMVLKVHLYGTFFCTRHASAIMRQQRFGRIISTSSQAGLGNMGQANYSAAKEGIVGFTRTAARDLGRYGVTCNAIRPRAATRMTINPELIANWERAGRRDLVEELQALDPNDIAPLITFLASDAGDNINGSTFLVYKGYVGIYPELAPSQALFKEGSWTVEDLVDVVPKTIGKNRERELGPSF
ncbi:MAG: SDR family oxidoreductase [Dehalococcoidia bacterium]|jgi:NAD(P)-dependent dehydrogenase (short-subunit alcohol dehydrogenase family)|nr:SDR family oxidoreductase [Dehalococcoidia bacterium]